MLGVLILLTCATIGSFIYSGYCMYLGETLDAIYFLILCFFLKELYLSIENNQEM